jgi:hypothetical protein
MTFPVDGYPRCFAMCPVDHVCEVAPKAGKFFSGDVDGNLLVTNVGKNVIELLDVMQGKMCRNRFLIGRYRTLLATEGGENVEVRQRRSVVPQSRIHLREYVSGRQERGFSFHRGRGVVECFLVLSEIQV